MKVVIEVADRNEAELRSLIQYNDKGGNVFIGDNPEEMLLILTMEELTSA